MPHALSLWYAGLCLTAALNIGAWAYAARRLAKHRADWPPAALATRRLVLWLGAGYVLGCAFRSVLPMLDGPRWCLHDTVLSRIALGRSVATIAELCLAAQLALLLREAGASTARPLVDRIAYALLPLIVAAEILSWLAVLAQNNLLHAFENSLWTLGGVLVLTACVALRDDAEVQGRRLLAAASVGTAAYIAFMAVVDVPMYLTRWQADVAAGQASQSLAAGLVEIMKRCEIVRAPSAWREDMPWLTLYFSVAVWISILLSHTPPLGTLLRGTPRNPAELSLEPKP